ncbi:dihydroneopterin aldolase [Marinilabilia rubra]|uniref:Dihydroneopterin triphosphate 2'-epimerase n=1 Tax=Marinilabilia rubra TaxID=2162893 RepID=A0A2U2B6T3_9BACT|nr:dihydroneopterin aldolase [Marinilabilia rubra]PWD98752.1 dihydroneopterin triphosphate 2'-epimerase [Marinilabilia rubra]
MATISIKDLLLRTQVGFNPHELGKKQDIVINLVIDYSLNGEEDSDEPEEALDYRDICKTIIALVESKSYNLLEKIANDITGLLLQYQRVQRVTVEVDKPHALRFSKSVSFSITKNRKAN